MVWKADDPQGNESGKIKYELVQYTTGRGIDVGCGPWKAFSHFIGVDNFKDTALYGIHMKPDVVCGVELELFGDRSVDFVYSSHTLEHIEDTKTLRAWWRVIKPNGYLILYLPHKDFYPNIGNEFANKDHKHDFLPIDVIRHMDKIGGWDLVRNEDRNEDNEYSFFQVYRKTGNGVAMSCKNSRPKKKAGVVRYGGIGDMVQASSVLPGLKRQGYHVTLYTTPDGLSIMKHDPHIDAWYIQGKDQVPAEELPKFWANEEKKYDRWINLSESVEGTWLALPGRTSHSWPHHLRDKYLSRNYLEFLHDFAAVPHSFEQKFYATEDEKATAKADAEQIGGRIVAWSLSGSGLHKAWPYTDTVIARLMVEYDDVKVVLMGDDFCKILAENWKNEPRVIRTCGEWPIRKSLAFLEHADVIVGPETGVLNAAGFLDVPKVIMLSHSSEENLTKHWTNTKALKPEGVKCFPCHMMHYTWEHCWEDKETGAAMCQAQIGPDQAWDAIKAVLR